MGLHMQCYVKFWSKTVCFGPSVSCHDSWHPRILTSREAQIQLKLKHKVDWNWPSVCLLQACLVHTTETIRVRYFMDRLLERRRPVMLVGNAGTGKSVLVGDKLGSLDSDKYTIKNVPFNYYTTSAMLQGMWVFPPFYWQWNRFQKCNLNALWTLSDFFLWSDPYTHGIFLRASAVLFMLLSSTVFAICWLDIYHSAACSPMCSSVYTFLSRQHLFTKKQTRNRSMYDRRKMFAMVYNQ